MRDQLIKFVGSWEGCRLHRYNDVAGYPTIGYGRLLKSSDTLSEITQQQAEEFLWQDLQKALSAVHRYVAVSINEQQTIALTDFAFNLGVGCLQRSTLLMKLNRGDREWAAGEFVRYDKAGGRKIPGLLKRRHAEMELFLT